MIGRGNLLTSISFPSQDSGTLTAVMAVLCEWNGTDPQGGRGARADQASSAGPESHARPLDDGGGAGLPSARPRGHRAEPRMIPFPPTRYQLDGGWRVDSGRGNRCWDWLRLGYLPPCAVCVMDWIAGASRGCLRLRCDPHGDRARSTQRLQWDTSQAGDPRPPTASAPRSRAVSDLVFSSSLGNCPDVVPSW